MKDHSLREIKEMYHSFRLLPFPHELRGEEINGVDFVLLDSYCAGLIHTFLGNSGRLYPQQIKLLKEQHVDLKSILPEVPANGQVYFMLLDDIISKTLSVVKS